MLRVVLKLLYWLAVVVISLALVVALILFFESRDQSQIEGGAAIGVPAGSVADARRVHFAAPPGRAQWRSRPAARSAAADDRRARPGRQLLRRNRQARSAS